MTSQAGHCQESPMKMLTTQFMTERLSHLLPITQPRDFPCAYPHYFFHQSGLVISKRSSEHTSNRSQTAHFISLCQAAEPWPQVTLLTQTAATSSTPVSLPASAVHYGCIQHLVGYAPFSAQWAATQFPLCLALAFWAGFVLADLRHTQKKKDIHVNKWNKTTERSHVGSMAINPQDHCDPELSWCLSPRTAAPFAPPHSGLSEAATINLNFAKQCNDNK